MTNSPAGVAPSSSPPPLPRRVALVVLTGRAGPRSGEAQNVGVAPLCALGLRVVESATVTAGERRRRGSPRMTAMPGCGSDTGAQDASSPHTAHRSRTGPPHQSLSFALGIKRHCQSGPVGRGGPLIEGGGIGCLSSFLAAPGWRLGRGASHGRTTNPLCPRFTWESPQRAPLGRARHPTQIGFGRTTLRPNLTEVLGARPKCMILTRTPLTG